MCAQKKHTGKVGRGGRNDPLPAFNNTLFGPFGALEAAHIEVVHAGERWYGDGAPKWKKAPASMEAHEKRIAAVKRLQHRNFAAIMGACALATIFASCAPEMRCGSHACPECGRADQRWLVDAFGKALRQRDQGFDDWAFTLVMPEGQTRIGSRCNVDFAWIMALCHDALDACADVKFAVLGFDISANDDSEKFRHGRLRSGPHRYIQVHLYGIVRAASRQAVWDCLRPLFQEGANIYRPLFVSDSFDGSNKGISYICKPDGYRHVAYRDKNGDWTTVRPAPALKAREQVHYLIASHELGFAGRVAFVGLHPELTPLKKGNARAIALRRIVRRGCAM